MKNTRRGNRIFVASVVLWGILIMQPGGGRADESWLHSVREGLPGTATSPDGVLQAAGYDEKEGKKDQQEPQLSNLGLLNFFSEGWDQPWAHRHGETPDMALLRVTTNFLEREFRLDYAYTDVRNKSYERTSLLDALIAYGLNRRLMIEVVGYYQWNLGNPSGAPDNGATAAGVLRFQLVDTPDKSYAAQVRVTPPNNGIGQTQTSFQYTLAGWQDMQALFPFLKRVGLYYSFQYENFQGSSPSRGERSNDISYDITIAKTWTRPTTPVLGNFTTFLEFYATQDLDGENKGVYLITLTPGFRFWFTPLNSLIFGVDLPVTNQNAPAPTTSEREVYRVTYILNF